MIDLEIQRGLKKGPYVEFNISGDEHRYHNWEDESLYLDETVFSVFAGGFDRSVNNFNYYGPTRYRGDDLLKLKRELGAIDSKMAAIVGKHQFVEKMAELTHSETFIKEASEVYELTSEWDEVLGSLKNVGRTLLDLVNQCVREGRILWVLGN